MTSESASKLPSGFSALPQYSDRARWIAFRIVKSEALADEAVQDAFLGLLRRPPPESYGEEHMRNLFFKAVRSCAFKLAEKERNIVRREDAFGERKIREAAAAEEAGPASELALAARSALNSLPLAEREAVSLCCEQGYTHQVAGEILGISKQAVGYRVNRGLKKLRKILTSQGFATSSPPLIAAALGALPLPPSGTLPAFWAKASVNSSALYSPSAPSLSAASIKSASGFFLLPLLTAVVVIAATATIWRSRGALLPANAEIEPAQKTAENDSHADDNVRANAAHNDKLNCVWSFENGPPTDLQLICGEWKWIPKSGKHQAGMDCSDIPIFSLPTVLPKRPVLVVLTVNHLGTKHATKVRASVWSCDDNLIFPYTSWRPTENLNVLPAVIPIRNYLFDRHEVVFWQETLAYVSLIRNEINDRQLIVRVGNGILEKIELRELTPEEIPESIRDPDALIRDLENKGVVPEYVRGLTRDGKPLEE